MCQLFVKIDEQIKQNSLASWKLYFSEKSGQREDILLGFFCLKFQNVCCY